MPLSPLPAARSLAGCLEMLHIKRLLFAHVAVRMKFHPEQQAEYMFP